MKNHLIVNILKNQFTFILIYINLVKRKRLFLKFFYYLNFEIYLKINILLLFMDKNTNAEVNEEEAGLL